MISCVQNELFQLRILFAVSNVLHLWEFMRDLLKDPSRRGDIIEWISEKDGVFRVVNSAEVARLWGEKKKNKKEMTYEKMSRSLRYEIGLVGYKFKQFN